MNKAERTRQFIIERSAPLFNTKGVAGTSMSDIMEVTKMAKGGLYGHFETKEELSYAAADYNLNTLGEKLTRALISSLTAKAKLLACVDFFSDPLHPPVEGGCPMLNFGMEADDTNPTIRKKVKARVEVAERLFQSIVEEGIKNGEFRKDSNAREFAIKMFALIEGGTMICRIVGSNAQMKTIAGFLHKEIDMLAKTDRLTN
jgi:TetR/AcrR family transcriptional regulator, transcriptional repressor for nem operon